MDFGGGGGGGGVWDEILLFIPFLDWDGHPSYMFLLFVCVVYHGATSLLCVCVF